MSDDKDIDEGLKPADITPETFPSHKKVNILEGIAPALKEPESFVKIQKALLDTLTCGKSHGDPFEMSNCVNCTENMARRYKLMSEFGFKSIEQYMAWRKVHEKIQEKVPYDWK